MPITPRNFSLPVSSSSVSQKSARRTCSVMSLSHCSDAMCSVYTTSAVSLSQALMSSRFLRVCVGVGAGYARGARVSARRLGAGR